MANDVEEIKKSIGTLVDSINNLVKMVGQNQSALLAGNKGSGYGRYSTGLFGYSNMLTGSKNTEELRRMFEAAEKTNRQSASFFGRLFKDITHEKRNLEALKIDLDRNIGDFEKKAQELRNALGSTTKDTSALFKEASEKIKEYNEELNNLKDSAGDSLKNILGTEEEEQLQGILSIIKEINSLKSADADANKDKIDALETEKNSLLQKLNLTDDEIEKYSEILILKGKIGTLTDKENEALSKGTDVLNQQINLREQSFRTMREGLSQIKSSFKEIDAIGKQFADAWAKVDTASSNFARSMGLGANAMNALRKNTIGRIANTNLSDLYGVGMEDLIKLQAGYGTSIGRAVGLSDLDQENAIAMSVVMGERGGQLAASLENFGLSYTDAASRAGKMFKDASKYGLSFEKYSENFLTNIKIAQNYTFKNGLKGLESMAKKATAIKLDMQQVAAFADKVGSLQGSVETAAKLQVLGGPFAQFSDPLGMLNESMTDMEGLMDRFQKMVGGFGRFNSTTGQIDVSSFNRQRIRAAAEAMGMSYDQVMESVLAQGRRNFVEKQLTGNFSDEEREFIMNTATVKNGKAMLSYIDESGNRVERDASKISKDELKAVRAQNQSQSDDIKDIAKDTRQLAQQLTGIETKKDAVRAKGYETIHEGVSKGISTINKNLGIIIGITTGIAAFMAIGGIFKGIGGIRNGASALRGVNGTASPGMMPIGGLGSTTVGRAFNAGAAGHTVSGGFLSRSASKYGAAWGKEAARTGASSAGAALKSSALKGLGVGLGAEIVGQGGGYLIDSANKENISRGKYKQYSEQDISHRQNSAALKGAGTGAALGATIGSIIPGIGTAVGAAVGALGGSLWGFFKEKKQIKEEKAQIENGQVTMDSGEISVAEGNFNFSDINPNSRVNRAKGGYLQGPSHKDKSGGMPILGSNIYVEGGEYVVNKEATSKNLGLLQKINTMGDGGIIKPRMLGNGGTINVMPPVSTSNEVKQTSSSTNLSAHITGNITLELNGYKKDITNELLNNPVFIRNITDKISRQTNFKENGGHIVTKGLQDIG